MLWGDSGAQLVLHHCAGGSWVSLGSRRQPHRPPKVPQKSLQGLKWLQNVAPGSVSTFFLLYKSENIKLCLDCTGMDGLHVRDSRGAYFCSLFIFLKTFFRGRVLD